jgi:hypothetical protein
MFSISYIRENVYSMYRSFPYMIIDWFWYFAGTQNAGSGSGLHSLQEVDDMDFALEEEMIPELDDGNLSEFAQAGINQYGEPELEVRNTVRHSGKLRI